jgi:hypothetical protein
MELGNLTDYQVTINAQEQFAAAYKYNLKDPQNTDAAFRLKIFGSWTFTPTGAKPNGTNAYMDTQCTPTQMVQDSCHLMIYNRTNSSGNFVDIGCTTISASGNDFQIVSRFTGNFNYSLINAINVVGFTQSISSGFQLISRIASTGFNYFSNITKTSVTKVSIAPNNLNIYIGARNVNNLIIDNPTNRQCAFVSIGDGLTDAEAAAFYTIVQQFQTSMGRQINP